ncbi:mosquitocidal toxin [Fusarium coicis]|nr:mosquitocidal toxin [Fusarium coicis]
MGIKISDKFVNDLTTKLIKAADDGKRLEVADPEEVGQYVCSVLALGCELIPVVGSSLGALVTLFGSIFFHPNATEKMWEKLRDRIEALVDTKIAETQMVILRKKIQGFRDNMDNYKRVWEDYRDSTANIHLMLLSDGIRHGRAWGYSEKNINTMRAEFKKKTSPQGVAVHAASIASEQSHLLKGAIATAINQEIPMNVVDTWKGAYSDLTVYASGSAGNGEGYDDLDYVTYVYRKGRGKVKAYKAELNDADNRGSAAAARLRAYADYDSGMIMNVLNYAEYWPYLAGDEMPESMLRKLDREIYFDPFGRHTTNATWSESSESPVSDRGSPITSAYVRGWDDIDGLQMRYGYSWGHAYGSTTGGAPKQLDLAEDEYFYWISVYYGQKLGKVRFWNNKDKALECGSGKHGSYYGCAAPPGYRLTNVHITKWESFTPTGCEGIILGFRPSIIEFTPN